MPFDLPEAVPSPEPSPPPPDQAALDRDWHSCGQRWLVADSTERQLRWCTRCGAAVGAPGGVRPTVALERATTHYS